MTQIAELTRAGLFRNNVPRYTSYPTATQFSGDTGPVEFSNWLAQLPTGDPVSVYAHIPFCERLCWYCACRTQGVRSATPVLAYVDTLLAEIELLRPHLPAGLRMSRLHFGGGSPTILPPAQIARLVGALRDLIPLDNNGEFSVEIDPAAIDDARLDAFIAAGMTRASIGVQDFAPEVQQAIGRIQSYETTAQVVDGLRNRGIGSINLDLVYGLPHQTMQRFNDTLEKTLQLGPDRIALFGYAHVPWMAKRQKMISEAALPDANARYELFETASQRLQDAGYIAIGIDHFAKPTDTLAIAARTGHLRRNFQGYTDDAASSLIGLGASSISRLPGGYIQNAPVTTRYNAAIKSGHLSATKGFALGLDDRVRARAIEMLMCDFALDIDQLAASFGDFARPLAKVAAAVERDYPNFVAFDGSTLVIQKSGRALTRLIAQMFDSYAVDQSRHSSAI